MTLLNVIDAPNIAHFRLYEQVNDPEKRASVQLSGLLQATKSGHLILGVPASLVRGVFDAMTEPGISMPSAVDGGTLRAAIVVMTPDELESLGGAAAVTERGKQFKYQIGELVEQPARNWPGVSACWHLKVIAPELGKLRRTYGLPTKLSGDSDFSIVVACRKVGVLAATATSKSTQQASSVLPDWAQ